MASVLERHNLITGQFRFSPSVSHDQVINLATRLKDEDSAGRIKQMIVRSCGKKQYAIMFVIEFDGTQKTFKKMVYAGTDNLLREFGRNVNWDITEQNWVIE